MDVITPRSLDEAVRLKSELPDARFVQGGTDVLVELNFDRSRPAGADQPQRGGRAPRLVAARTGRCVLGAGLTYAEAMARAARRRAARARGGVEDGRIAADSQPGHARRQSRHGLACRRLAAAAARRGRDDRGGERAWRAGAPARASSWSARSATRSSRDELIVAVCASHPSGARQTFMKVGPRNAMVIAVCSLALSVDRDAARSGRPTARPGRSSRWSARRSTRRAGSRTPSPRPAARSTIFAGRLRTGGMRCASSLERALERCLA